MKHRVWLRLLTVMLGSLLLLAGMASAQASLASLPPEIVNLCLVLAPHIVGQGDPSVLADVPTDIMGQVRPSPPSIGAIECTPGASVRPTRLLPPANFRMIRK